MRITKVDVGVDTNDYYPYSFLQMVEIMAGKPDNFNYRRGERDEGRTVQERG